MTGGTGRRRPVRARSVLFVALGLAALAALLWLGAWQVHRRAWKLALIAQVERRLAAPPVPAPGPAEWGRIGPDQAYLKVRARGAFDLSRQVRVQALTELGGGYWVLAPLRTDRFTVLVNRGFVPADLPPARIGGPAGPVTVTGLLRLSEPGGGFLRRNDPAAGRWYSRDVAAIARAERLGPVAPYFVDADATPNPGGRPVGGLTVVRFPNNHLVYALTWYGLALMIAGALALFVRAELRGGLRGR